MPPNEQRMLEESKIREIAQDVFNSTSNKNMYGVAPTPAHAHTGADSLHVSYLNLDNKIIVYPFTIQGTNAATTTNYSRIFIAPYLMRVISISEIHAVKGTDGSAVSLQVEKLTGTTAPGSGTVLLNTAFDLKGTINTLQTGSLVTPASLNLAVGDGLALKLTGTPTSVANVTVTIVLQLM